MKNTTKRKSAFVFVLAVIAAVLAIIVLLSLNKSSQPAHAETYNSADDYNFTLVTDSDGNSSYKAAIKTTLRNSVTVAVVPDSYNGLPVTELANNAFMSCKLLTKVVLPKSITKIGNNAFINCSQLKLVHMPNVESIGATAFSMCGSLDRLYIPKTVKTVGANILRNNANTVYVQSAQEDLGEGWSSKWNDYHTGEVVYSAEPEDSIAYREIYKKDTVEVIGYEICEEQTISAEEADVVIYNAYRPDENSEYLPVLNICQEAFSGVTLRSLTIKDRPNDDDGFPVFDHAINIRSDAFFFACIDTINIETNVTFNHPADLQVGSSENILGEPITGDEDGHSIGVFEESLMYSVTLPANVEAIYDRMFYNCTNLKSIKIAGQEYDGTNRLPNVSCIGDGAFSSCGVLENITIPYSVTKMGGSVFYDWGTCTNPDTHQKIQQVINIEHYVQTLPAEWGAEWADGIYEANVTVNYKEAFVNIHLCDGTDEFITVSVTPGLPMPEIEIPTYDGHIFKGIYSEQDGEGVQYYTSSGVSAREWKEGDPSDLYVNWGSNKYRVSLVRAGQEPFVVDAYFGQSMPAAPKPEKRGYIFKGYYYLESDGTKTYYYDQDMSSYQNWDKSEDCTLYPDWEVTVYYITYENLLNGYNPIENPTEYTVESETIELFNPDGRTLDGYIGKWDIMEITKGSVGDKTITAIWTPIIYKIKYVIDKEYTNPNAEITTFTVEDEIHLEPPTGKYYYAGWWDMPDIPNGTARDLVITAIWTPITYYITYVFGVVGPRNPNPVEITVEDTVKLQLMERSGYMQLGWQLNGEYVSTLSNIHQDITLVAVWSDGMVVNVDSKMSTLRVTVNKMTVRLPVTNLSRQHGFTIYVTSDVTELTIIADKSTENYYMNVDLSGAIKDFTLNLENICMTSRWSDSPTINMPSHKLFLNTKGNCYIYGADATNDSYSSKPQSSGGVAISCHSLEILTANKLVIKGGNGANCYGSGGIATNGGYAVLLASKGRIGISVDNVSLIGGNGGNAEYGAKQYGQGSAATNKGVGHNGNKITITDGSNGKVV